MYEVRSYSDKYHPDLFRRDTVLGVSIWALNFLRWKLEVFVQYLTLRYFLRDQKFSPKKSKEVLETFKLDVLKEKAECFERSPLRMFPLPDMAVADTPVQVAPIPPPTPVDETRGKPLTDLFAKYAPRRKGGIGWHNYTFVEDRFSPVEKDLDEKKALPNDEHS